MTSRARELPYTDNDQVELVRRCGAVKQLVRQWPKRRLNAGGIHQYLGEIAAATERLFAWVDELWLYGTGGRVAFDAEIAEEDAADPSTLSVAQLQRRCSRDRWSAAVALAGRLAGEAHATGDLEEAQRLERAFVRTVLPWLPAELRDKDAVFDRSAFVTMLRGDRPSAFVAVSLDDRPEIGVADSIPKVVPSDDPLEFSPATRACRRIGLFAELPATTGLHGRAYPRIETVDVDA
jgi:hypothetical protein